MINHMKLITAGVLLGIFIAIGGWVVFHPAMAKGDIHYLLPVPYHVDAASTDYTPAAPIIGVPTEATQTETPIDYATPIQGASSQTASTPVLTAKEQRMIEIIKEINALYAELSALQAEN